MTPEEPEHDPPAPPLLPFSALYPDLFAHLTPDQARTIDLSLCPADGSKATTTPATDVADLIAAATGRISVDEYKKSLM